ncbi:MAG: SCO family protein [Candidatus Scalinduaceae bacterium]
MRFIIMVFVFSLYHLGNLCAESLLSSVFAEKKIYKSQGKETDTKGEISEPGTSHKPFTLINQNNEPVALDSLMGKLLVMSFIYTRCSMPDMCPLIMKKIVKVQKGLKKEYKDKVFFAIVTLDPEYDTPTVLKEFGHYYRVDYGNLIFLTGKKDDVDYALNHFRVYYKEESQGVLAHTMETLVMDEAGVIRKDFPASFWKPEDVIEEVEKIIEKREASKE